MKDIWAIVLAGGESTRMKTNKLLLPYEKGLIITTIIDHLWQSKVNHILVVLGAYKEAILDKIAGLRVRHCFNRDYTRGMLSSIQCGFSNLPKSFDAALICLGDQPMISTQVVDQLIGIYQNTDKGILVPTYNGKRGHPILVDHKYHKEVSKLDEKVGLRGLLSTFSTDVQELEVSESGILRDIDTPEDYLNETQKK